MGTVERQPDDELIVVEERREAPVRRVGVVVAVGNADWMNMLESVRRQLGSETVGILGLVPTNERAMNASRSRVPQAITGEVEMLVRDGDLRNQWKVLVLDNVATARREVTRQGGVGHNYNLPRSAVVIVDPASVSPDVAVEVVGLTASSLQSEAYGAGPGLVVDATGRSGREMVDWLGNLIGEQAQGETVKLAPFDGVKADPHLGPAVNQLKVVVGDIGSWVVVGSVAEGLIEPREEEINYNLSAGGRAEVVLVETVDLERIDAQLWKEIEKQTLRQVTGGEVADLEQLEQRRAELAGKAQSEPRRDDRELDEAVETYQSVTERSMLNNAKLVAKVKSLIARVVERDRRELGGIEAEEVNQKLMEQLGDQIARTLSRKGKQDGLGKLVQWRASQAVDAALTLTNQRIRGHEHTLAGHIAYEHRPDYGAVRAWNIVRKTLQGMLEDKRRQKEALMAAEAAKMKELCDTLPLQARRMVESRDLELDLDQLTEAEVSYNTHRTAI